MSCKRREHTNNELKTAKNGAFDRFEGISNQRNDGETRVVRASSKEKSLLQSMNIIPKGWASIYHRKYILYILLFVFNQNIKLRYFFLGRPWLQQIGV